jgi:hypothetical protein
VVSTVIPSSGQVGTRVTISGSSLRGFAQNVVEVNLAGEAATVESETDSQVIAVCQGGIEASGDVVVRANTGATTTKIDAWETKKQGSISSVLPIEGTRGTEIVIEGLSLRGFGSNVAKVSLAGVEAKIKNESDTSITVEAGTGPNIYTTGDVVLTATTGAVVSLKNGFAYVPPGVIQGVDPVSGFNGSRVEISGLLCGVGSKVASVTLVDVEADIDESESSCASVLVTAIGRGYNGTGDVTVRSDTGDLLVLENGWTYLNEGAIDSVYPSAGQKDTEVLIQGTRLFGGGSGISLVELAGKSTLILPGATDTSVRVIVRQGTGQGDVVITSDSGVILRLKNGWTYSTIDSVTPSQGQRGTVVTITGTSLLAGGTGVASITLAGVSVAPTNVLRANQTQIAFVATPFAVDSSLVGDIVIDVEGSNQVQRVTSEGTAIKWTYLKAGSINTLQPISGQGGTRVTIGGIDLFGHGTGIESVSLAGVLVQVITKSTNTEVEVVAAKSDDATVGDVVITSNTGSKVILTDGTVTDRWSYVEPQIITSVFPSSGQVNTVVTIVGTGLLAGDNIDSVKLGSFFATEIVSATNNKIEVKVADLEVDVNTSKVLHDVTVIAGSGATVTAEESFRYAEKGRIDDVAPKSGHGGTVVVITGQRLRCGGARIDSATLGGAVATIVDQNDETVYLQAAPSSAKVGDIVLTSDTGATVTRVGGWEYLAAGHIAGLNPSSGRMDTKTTITGTNLLGGGLTTKKVSIGGVAVQNIVSFSNTQVVVVVGTSSSIGPAIVEIVSDTGATVTSSLSVWEYISDGNIAFVKPEEGQEGTRVVLSGTEFLGGGSNIQKVSFGGFEAALVGTGNDTAVEVIAGATNSSTGGSDIVITSDTGATTSKIQGFVYLEAGEIERLVPNEGQVGTKVVLEGKRMLGGGSSVHSVSLGGVTVSDIIPGGTDERIEVTAGSKAAENAGDAVVVSNTGSIVTLKEAWTYLRAGVIDNVFPSSGQKGTRVVISGSDLLGGGSKITSAKLASLEVLKISSSSDTKVEVVAADGFGMGISAGGITLESDTGALISATFNATRYDECQ